MSFLGYWKDGVSGWVCSEKPVTLRSSLEQAAITHLRNGLNGRVPAVSGLGEEAVPLALRVVRGSSVGRWGPQDKG